MINGIINIYKEKDFTSHDVVAKLRGICGQKKIGHTGTLDPQATGVLPVCLGSATRLCELLTDHSKEYRALMRLGVVTDTQDMTGQIISEREVCISEKAVTEAMAHFVGEYDQLPPMYSAIKVGGRRLYELARKGEVVERNTRRVVIDYIDILSVRLPLVEFKVGCSKGTYIRTLCHDIGEKLGTGACMESLERTRVGDFRIEDSITLSELERFMKSSAAEESIKQGNSPFTTVECFFGGLPGVVCSQKMTPLLANGNAIYTDMLGKDFSAVDGDRFRMYDTEGQFRAVYEYSLTKNALVPWKMFPTEQICR